MIKGSSVILSKLMELVMSHLISSKLDILLHQKMVIVTSIRTSLSLDTIVSKDTTVLMDQLILN